MTRHPATRPLLPLTVLALTVALPAARAQFNPGPNPITGATGAQTLTGGTGTITATGAISFNGTTPALTISGNGTTLVNSGLVENTANSATNTARGILADGTNLQITNQAGGILRTLSQDVIRSSAANTSISLLNNGTITSNPDGTLVGPQQAIDWTSITTGANSVTNNGSILATGADSVRPGANGIVNNNAGGVIRATPLQISGNADGNDGIDAQNRTGIQVTNAGTVSGRHGITGGATTFAISVTNQNGGIITGVNGSGINIDNAVTTSVATVVNAAGATITGNWDGVSANGDGDGVDVDGVLTLTNRGIIRALGANGNGSDGFANGPDGVAAGGGTITNETGAEITAAVTRGNAATSQAILVDNSSRGNAIAATTVTNRGLIRSDHGAAIVLISTFANTVTNDAGGTIRGAGAAAVGAAIQTGNGNDTLTNRGAIVAATNGLAVDLQGGNNTLRIEGGAASITGDVSGGAGGGTNALFITPGPGNAFIYAGSFSNFATAQIGAGTVTLSGNSTYTGATTIAGGGTLVAANAPAAGSSATGTGAVTVQGGGTLAGTGRVGGNVTLAANGRLSPSNAGSLTPGLLTLDAGLTVSGGSRFAFTLASTAATSDRLVVNGALTFTGATSDKLVFDVIDGGLTTGQRYALIDFTGGAPGLSTDNLAFGNTPAGFSGTFDLTSGSLGLTVTTVPEPATASALLVGSLALGGGAWLKRRRPTIPSARGRRAPGDR